VVAIGRLVGQVVVPLALAYAAFLAMVIATTREWRPGSDRPIDRSAPTTRGEWRAFLRGLLLLLLSGFVLFVAIVAVFYWLLGGQPPGIVTNALRWGAALAFGVVLPAFILLTLAQRVIERRQS